jgi:hypothetical protein
MAIKAAIFFKQQKNHPKSEKNTKNTMTFFNPETDSDRKPTFEQKTDPDPDRLPKVHPAGL